MDGFGTLGDAISRIKYGLENPKDARPLAVLAGAGTSLGSVPGVNQILHSVRKIFDKEEQLEFDRRLADLGSPGLKYQTAFLMLAQRRPSALRDRIVRLSVLRAYPPLRDRALGNATAAELAEEDLFAAESDVDGWVLPPGIEALGRIWAGLPPALRGPIITTNFDPLIEIAIRRAGAVAVSQWMDADGSFLHHLSLSEACSIIHLHGFWRDSQTLSMTAQLTQPRDSLAGSLRALLGKYSVVVVGYSGWRDAVMMQLERTIAEQSGAHLDVLWCSFSGPEELNSEILSNPQLAVLQRAPGNVQFYAGIDANEALPALERAISSELLYIDRPRLEVVHGVPTGWTPVDKDLLSQQSSKDSRERAIAFFDGREPTLRDAFNGHIPRRDVVFDVARDLTRGDRIGPTLTLILGASGEGKSTALLQLAKDLLDAQPEATVLWNQEGTFPGASDILMLPAGSPVYLLADNVDAGIMDLKSLVRQLNSSDSSHIHIVAASRDTDWHSVGGSTFAWRNYVNYRGKTLRGLSRPDAVAIIDAWEGLGATALGQLASVRGRESRISYLMDAARDEELSGDGTLLGAALSARFGEGLVDHIRQLALRLHDRAILNFDQKARGSLLDALTYVSIPHAVGVRALSTSLLGDVFRMSKPELAAFVIGPLADEAPMAVMQDRVVTRHRLIAAAVLQCAEELGVQLDDHIKLLVQTAVRRIDRHGPSEDLKAIAYISREMTDSRQALIAARAAAEANPNRLSYQARLSSALREAGQPAQAEELCQRAIETAPSAEDSADGIRGLVTEWGVCWGNLGDYTANAYLAAVALADLRGATPPHLDGVEFSMRCFGLGLSQVWASQAAPEHAAAMRGVVSIFGLLGFESTRHSWLRNYERAASSAAPLAKTSSAAVDAILVSAGLLQDSVGARFNIPGLGRLSMDGLQNALEQRYGL